MTDSDTNTVYEPGDVVYGMDPFKGAGAARPWLVVSNHEGRPFHGDQYHHPDADDANVARRVAGNPRGELDARRHARPELRRPVGRSVAR